MNRPVRAACRVVWGLEVRHLRVPDYMALFDSLVLDEAPHTSTDEES
jgi:hypothetical protein